MWSKTQPAREEMNFGRENGTPVGGVVNGSVLLRESCSSRNGEMEQGCGYISRDSTTKQ